MKRKMNRTALTLALMALPLCAQPRSASITSLLVRSWFADFNQPDIKPAGVDLPLRQAAQAARQGRFNDAERFLKQAGQMDGSARAQLLHLLFQRLTLNLKFSLVSGGFGPQRQLQLRRVEAGPDEPALQLQTMAAMQHFPTGTSEDDAQSATLYFPVVDACQTLVPSLLRMTIDGDGAPAPPAGFSDGCRVAEGALNSDILGTVEKTIVEKATLGGLAAATGDTASARRLFAEGRTAAIGARLPRSQAEFDLRLGDLLSMPHGHWMTLGYNQLSEGVTRAVLEAGGFPKARSAPSDEMLAEAAKWYADAARLAGEFPSDELVAAVQFRQACLAYMQGNTAGATSIFAAAGDAAQRAGWMRAAAMGWGLAAITSADEARYRKALHSLGEQGDVGGTASLVETAQSYAAILRFRGELRAALAITQMALRAAVAERAQVGLEGLMTNLALLYKLNGDTDLRLYWARAAVADEEAFIAESSKYFIDPGFLQSENTHLWSLLNDVALELFSRTLTEGEFWASQLRAIEKRMSMRVASPLTRNYSEEYRRMTADMSQKYELLGRIASAASCEPGKYEGLRAELMRQTDASLLFQLDQFLGGCGDAAVNLASRERLRTIDMAGLLQILQDNSRRGTIDEQQKFGQANRELSVAMGDASAFQDLAFLELWLDKIEKSQGVTPSSYFARLEVLLGTGRPEQARDQALRTFSDKVVWKRLEDHDRLGVLGSLVEAYAQLGEAQQGLATLLTLWREQSRMNHASPGPFAGATVLRRGALLRTAPENLSAQEKEELQRLCLENPIDTGAPSLVDASRLIGNIPPGVTVLVYFPGWRTWLWRLEKGVVPALVPLAAPREVNLTLTRFNDKFAGTNTTPGWEPDSASLYAKLVQPAGRFRAGQVLAIAGAGYLRGLPFDALGPSGGKLLGEQHPIVYVEDLLADAPSLQKLPRRAAIVGFNGPSLDHAEDEAKEIAALLGVKALIGPDARRARVSQELKAATWIHFSTHGFIDKVNPYRSHLALSDNEQIQGFELPSMAGSATMITFSACDSNVAFVPTGAMPQPGFARGLTMFAHGAGARWVVSSLWKADDDASLKLMVAYYRQLLSGQSPPMALFKAKSQYIDQEPELKRKAPWFWAGFTVSALTLADLVVPQ
jgi:CHAT domain-containing protein